RGIFASARASLLRLGRAQVMRTEVMASTLPQTHTGGHCLWRPPGLRSVPGARMVRRKSRRQPWTIVRPPSSRRWQGQLEPHPAAGRIEVALKGWRFGRLHPQHIGRAIALAQQARAADKVCRLLHGRGALDARAGGDLLEVYAQAGVAFLITGLAVVALSTTRIDRSGGLRTAIVARAPRFTTSSP